MRPASPRTAVAALIGALLAGAAGSGVAACGVTDVDLGADRQPVAGTGAGTGGSVHAGPVTTSDCPALTEAQAEQIYGTPCDGDCSEALGAPRVLASSGDIEAVSAGRWLTCGGEPPWTTQAAGIEFQAGCTLFLVYALGGDVYALGATPDDQGTYNVLETTDGTTVTRAIQMFFPSWTATFSITTSDCPHRMRLERIDGDAGHADGGSAIDLAALTTTTPPLQ